MRQTTINGVEVTAPEDADYEELLAYVEMEKKHYQTVKSMEISFDGEFAEITVHTANKPFERIRRITGQPDQ